MEFPTIHTDVCDYRSINRLNQATRYPPDQMDHADLWPPMKIWRGVHWNPPLKVHNCKCGRLSFPTSAFTMTMKFCSHGYSRSLIHPEFCDECDRYAQLSHPVRSFAPKRIYAPETPSSVDDFLPPPTPQRHSVENPGFLVARADNCYRGITGIYKRPRKQRKARKTELAQLIEFQRNFKPGTCTAYAYIVNNDE